MKENIETQKKDKETTNIEQVVQKVSKVEMDEYGCIIKPIGEIITTKQPEAEIAAETEEE